MDSPRPDPASQCAKGHRALVILLHLRDTEPVALGLARAWAPAVPAARVSTLCIGGGGRVEEARAGVANRLEQASLDWARLVLVGTADTQDTLLQMVFGQAAVGCAGVLALGDSLPSLAVLGGHVTGTRAKLRLAWTADDPLFCAAALGGLLRCYRKAGVDAQGTVVARPDHAALEAAGNPGLFLPLVRLGGAYLAELVAVALGRAFQPYPGPAAVR